ncbi:MAG TPA: HAD-IA family hydrolase [Candidatus Limnocylindrales bacterium]|nr:HAD-IA family hydrolase [Candidatus Limnocylindrales bacterium]
MPIEAVIFDFDGVIRTWPRPAVTEIEGDAGLPRGSIARIAFGSAVLRDALLGRASRREWHADVARLAEARFGTRGLTAADRWSRLSGAVDPAMLELVGRVRARLPVALLSNADRGLRDELDASGLALAFDVIVISAEIGSAKPDPGPFLRAAELLGSQPSACLIVDDDQANVDAAVALGFVGLRHRSSSETQRTMTGLGVLSDARPGRATVPPSLQPHETRSR